MWQLVFKFCQAKKPDPNSASNNYRFLNLVGSCFCFSIVPELTAEVLADNSEMYPLATGNRRRHTVSRGIQWYRVTVFVLHTCMCVCVIVCVGVWLCDTVIAGYTIITCMDQMYTHIHAPWCYQDISTCA